MKTTLSDYCAEHHRPDLLRQWHPTKNAPLTPGTVTYGSKRKLWWRCVKGHEWRAAVYTRTGYNTECPYCAGKRAMPGKNDLASQRPDIAAQWHPTKNGSLTPRDLVAGSRRKVWWLCARGHEWQAMVRTRASAGAGCPVCAGRRRKPRGVWRYLDADTS